MSLTGRAVLLVSGCLTLGAFAALVVVWPRLADRRPRFIVARTGLLLGVNVLVLITAALQLNAQYLFFANWDDVAASLDGSRPASTLSRGGDPAQASRTRMKGEAAVAPAVLPSLSGRPRGTSGELSYLVHGPLSGLTGAIEVQLPPGYSAAPQSATKYPVIETFPGYPGEAGQWIRTMKLGSVINAAVQARAMRPTLIVSPQMEFPGGVDTEGVNGTPGFPQVETWLTRDVPEWVTHTFRVSTDRSSWTTIGFSAGGWAAAMATLLHPAQYCAAIVLGGYFTPQFGPLYEPYPPHSALAARYDLVALARRAPPPVALWLETSHSDSTSYPSSAAFLKAVRAPTAVDATVLRQAGHRISIWKNLLPYAIRWLGSTAPGFSPPPEVSPPPAAGAP
jgi:hypothetical protein